MYLKKILWSHRSLVDFTELPDRTTHNTRDIDRWEGNEDSFNLNYPEHLEQLETAELLFGGPLNCYAKFAP